MYVERDCKRGYTEYCNCDVNDGDGSLMDVAVLIMEDGDTFEFHEEKKEMAWIMLKGKATVEYEGKTAEMDRPNPYDVPTYCRHLCAGQSCKITAHDHCEFYVQKTYNDRQWEAHLYLPEETDTWHRGANGECGGCIKRDVRTSFDYEINPLSNMVLGEIIGLPGKWTSYPPHSHPQPECYFYYLEDERGFGATWVDGEVKELHHHGMSIITKGIHPVAMAPGYASCCIWGIRHLPGDPWKKTRIDDPVHAWLVDPKAKFWNGEDGVPMSEYTEELGKYSKYHK